jgi:hypothetical protein
LQQAFTERIQQFGLLSPSFVSSTSEGKPALFSSPLRSSSGGRGGGEGVLPEHGGSDGEETRRFTARFQAKLDLREKVSILFAYPKLWL